MRLILILRILSKAWLLRCCVFAQQRFSDAAGDARDNLGYFGMGKVMIKHLLRKSSHNVISVYVLTSWKETIKSGVDVPLF
jgi:hypothetical protein